MMQVPAHYRMTRPARYLSWTISAGIILTFHYFFMSDSPIRYISSNVTEPFNNDALKTPRKYEAKNLYKWTRALPVPHISGRPGELGKAVVLNAEEDEEAKRRFKEHEFNIVASDTISVNRSLADVRHPHCLSVEYLPRLPKTSVVIIFHNEAWSTLTRSIWSAINRSPKELLKEIILVDDKSTFDYLGNQLDEYVRTLRVPVKVLRMDERFGIVKARLLGAANAEFYYLFVRNEGIFFSGTTFNVTEPFNNDALKTPRKYEAKNLYKWTRALPVPHISGRPGELGKAVALNAQEDEEAKRRFKEHEFNIVASDMISVNRSLADVRHPHCLSVEYLPRLPKTSVVIIFHNEAWSTLTRSIWSAINRSPKELLKEIILVDDKSTFDYLGNQLDEYVKTLPVPVKVLRMDERFGIVKARLLGAANAEK
ncbi:Polypeptide N-acetylgalactosaminyltransferase 5, partial [Pseudolycoriella hygida]